MYFISAISYTYIYIYIHMNYINYILLYINLSIYKYLFRLRSDGWPGNKHNAHPHMYICIIVKMYSSNQIRSAK